MTASKKEIIESLSQCISDTRFAKMKDVVAQRTRHIVPVLEHIYRPENLSAALRSIEGLGIQDVHIVDRYASKNKLINRHVSKGGSKWIDMHYYVDHEGEGVIQCLQGLKKQGYRLLATTPHCEMRLNEVPIDTKTAVIFGNEVKGISQVTKEYVDGFVGIPMYGFTESFNISVSVAITLYDLMTRLRNSSVSWHLTPEEQDEICYQWLKENVPAAETIERRLINKDTVAPS